MPSSIVYNQCMRHSFLRQFPSGQARPLVSRPRLIHPDVHWDSSSMRRVNRRGRGAMIDKRQPAGIAVRQNVDRFTGFLARGETANDLQAVLTYALAGSRVFICD